MASGAAEGATQELVGEGRIPYIGKRPDKACPVDIGDKPK
jgi:hypothetical protein